MLRKWNTYWWLVANFLLPKEAKISGYGLCPPSPLLCLQIRLSNHIGIFGMFMGEKQQKSKQPVAPISVIFYGLQWWNKNKKYTYWTHNNTTNLLSLNYSFKISSGLCLPCLSDEPPLVMCRTLWVMDVPIPWNLQSFLSSSVGFWRGLDISHWQWEHVTHELKN